MTNYKFILFAFSLLLIFEACSSSKNTITNADAKVNELDKATELRNESAFINAMKAKVTGNFQEAATLFNQCINQNGANHAAMYELSKLYLESGQNISALIFAQGAAKLNPNNKWYLKNYAEALAANGKFKDAAKVYESLSNNNKADYDHFLDWAYMLEQAGEYEEATEVYDKIEKKMGVSEQLSFQKQKLYLKEGKIDEAAKEIQKLISRNPTDARYYGLLAELYDANDMEEEAHKIYEKIATLNIENPEVHLILADYYYKTGNTDKYLSSLKKVIGDPTLDIDLKVQMLYPYIQKTIEGKDSIAIDHGLKLGALLTETHPKEAKAYALYGDLLYQNKQSEEALIQYKKATQTDNVNFTVWQQILFIDSELGQNDSLLKHSEQVIELYPNQVMAHYFNGVARMLNKDYQGALAPVKKALEIGSESNPLLSQLYSTLGEIYHNLDDHNASDSSFEKAIAFSPDNALVLNNYSYYLSERGDKLDQAKRMSKKSIELQPDNSSYLDTYGWILYKQGSYKEARKWIEEALEKSDSDKAVIHDHYGDVLFKLGEEEKALIQWEQAKKEGLESDVIDKKIADKKLYE